MNLPSSSDAELLGLMGSHATDLVRARAAWEELFQRHRRYLYTVVWRAHGWRLGEDGTADLVVDTFVRARDWATRHAASGDVVLRFTGSTDAETRLKVRAWLGAIAKRRFQDLCREVSTDKTRHDEYIQEWLARLEPEEEPSDHPLASAMRDALSSLPPSDAEALRVSLPWYDPTAGAFMVPQREAARMAALLGISTDALRQRRHRAIQRLEAQLRATNAALPSKETNQ